MTHDAKRLPGQGPERHAIGITRTCLASGTVQLPFALAGALPQGEVLVRDVETDEGLVLWSDPPRRLAGLSPFFERHELQVNDSVVLEIDGDTLRMSTSKRPRRSRPAVQPSTWHSLRDEAPAPDEAPTAADGTETDGTAAPARIDGPAAAEPRHDDPAPAQNDSGGPNAPASVTTPAGPAATPAPPPEDGADIPPTVPVERLGDPAAPVPSDPSDDMPRAPHVKVRPLASDEGATAPAGRPARPSDKAATRSGPLGRLGRFARSIFGRGEGHDAARERAEQQRAERPDWTRAWDEDDDENDDVAPTDEFVTDGGAAATAGAPPADAADRPREPQAPVDDPFDAFDPGADAPHEDAGRPTSTFASGALEEEVPATDEERSADARSRDRGPADPVAPADRDAVDVDAVDVDAANGGAEGNGADADAFEELGDDRSEKQGVPDDVGPTPLFPDAVRGAQARRPVDETPSGVPARAERFLGGDLRTRLLRYLESPEMGSVAQADRIAKRFDLDLETAGEMLADIADDPPAGLRLRSVRDGAWRIERTPLR